MSGKFESGGGSGSSLLLIVFIIGLLGLAAVAMGWRP